MTIGCLIFGAVNLKREEIENRRVLEVGSLDVNGSLRAIAEAYKPREYIGVDIAKGRGVDRICDSKNLVAEFGKESFDVVICTEVIEHVREWRVAVHNLKEVCKYGGVILVTTRSPGFYYHGYPNDFWRYEISDMEKIFKDCIIDSVEKEPATGVCIKARKPEKFVENDLSGYELYSVLKKRRTAGIEDKDMRTLYFKRLVFGEKLRDFLGRICFRVISML